MNKINICGKEVSLYATKFGISFNQLTRVPKEIWKLKKLKHLDLSFNQLTSLPTEIGKLENLEYLYLSDNELTSLPTEIENLKNLNYLDLRKNNIPETEIKKIKELLPNCTIYNDYE